MPERLRFESEIEDLGLLETPDFDLSQDFLEWQKRGKRLHVDFYDRSNAHLQYLGQIILRSTSDQWEKRLINRSDLEQIYSANRLQTAEPADFAFSPQWAAPEDKLFPDKVGQQGSFNRTKLEEETRKPGRTIQIWNNAKQTKALVRLFEKAKKAGKEQGFYIVLKVYDIERRAALWLLPADPESSSAVHFRVNLGEVGTAGNKIRSVPNDPAKQVIGLVHTHYLKQKPFVQQSTTIGSSWRAEEKILKVVHAVSPEDIKSAIDNEFVVYALESNQIHKATPNGRANNGIKWPSFNVLEDALDSFSGKTT